MAAAFVSTAWRIPGTRQASSSEQKSTCGRRAGMGRVWMVSPMSKLLVVELGAVFERSDEEEIRAFSQRVEVDRRNSKDGTYVVYCGEDSYGSMIKRVEESGLVEANALVAWGGSELYQQGYRTPDPYWAKTVGRDWDPKPVRWVVENFFGADVLFSGSEAEYELEFKRKKGSKCEEGLCQKIENKLKEMGVTGRVVEREQGVAIMPAAGGMQEIIAFCCMMLRIEEESCFVFGRSEFVEHYLGDSRWGICGKGGEPGERVFVSDKVGAGALVDGVVRYAVF
eukprot:GFKZ01001540.1.p1 GENE.GFKZ01001540.1~~GFKZ01001540.1.p1  ORF type:complete len:282 (-),score=45.16 GFKZ01001540.1:327-1172(-)